MTKHGTGIGWTHFPGFKGETLNPLLGQKGKWHCTKRSPGCVNCYAETLNMNRRFNKTGELLPYKRGVDSMRIVPEILARPLHWTKPRSIFWCSMTDLFHSTVKDEWIAAVLGVMAATPQHIHIILTKRMTRALQWFNGFADSLSTDINETPIKMLMAARAFTDEMVKWPGMNDGRTPKWPLDNLVFCASVEDQERADRRIPKLYDIPAAVKGLSMEPLLQDVSVEMIPFKLDGFAGALNAYTGEWWPAVGDPDEEVMNVAQLDPLDWFIVGAESGANRRPFEVNWIRPHFTLCKDNGRPLYVKQDSGFRPSQQGRIPDEFWVHERPVVRTSHRP